MSANSITYLDYPRYHVTYPPSYANICTTYLNPLVIRGWRGKKERSLTVVSAGAEWKGIVMGVWGSFGECKWLFGGG